MPTPSSPLTPPEPVCPAVPPTPEPVSAEQPAPRVVREDGGGAGRAPWIRLVATDWSDGARPTYWVQIARGSSWWAPGDGTLWGPASGEEWMQMFIALARAEDERQQARASQATGGRGQATEAPEPSA